MGVSTFLFCLYKFNLSRRRVHPCNGKYQKLNQILHTLNSAAAGVAYNENDDTAQYDGSFLFCQLYISTLTVIFLNQVKCRNIFSEENCSRCLLNKKKYAEIKNLAQTCNIKYLNSSSTHCTIHSDI